MALRVYNTLKRTKEEFVSREPGKVGIYQCGPTVYAEAHVGHLRPLIFMDTVVRYLEHKGYEVTHVENFTDVDDKIIARANQEGVDPSEVAGRYIEEYLQLTRWLGVRPAAHYPRVSQHLAEIVDMVATLVKKGFAYAVDGDVYFDVSSFRDYGKLSGRSPEEMLAGARIRVDERKQDPLDFALWKAAKEGEPAWPSPWGPGRPGWHIECSAMSMKYLGMKFDIHGGGTDLVFPHHENEIAQSEAYADQEPFVNYWLHNGMLRLDKEKMSKSVGNIVQASGLVGQFRPEVVRLFMLSVHYRSPQEYDLEKMEGAQRAWERLANARDLAEDLAVKAGAEAGLGSDGAVGGENAAAAALLRAADRTGTDFEAAMDDDFNTALALASLFELAREVNATVNGSGFVLDAAAGGALKGVVEAFDRWGAILGIFNLSTTSTDDEGELVGRLVDFVLEIRDDARKNRDWGLADRIRDRLLEWDITVEDGPAGTRWKRKR